MIARILTSMVLLLVSSCSEVKFKDATEVLPSTDQKLEENLTADFKYSTNVAIFNQENYNDSITDLSFTATLSDGTHVNNLSKDQLQILENGQSLENFKLSANSQNIEQIVDIVFVLDISGSMKPTIESAKTRIREFIYRIREQKVHTRFCLVTFGDHTIDKCARFADNNPKDPGSWTQVEEFISRLTRLDTPTGWGADYGGTDEDEGQLRALIDASNAPWGATSQRFAILVTDASFHYAPENRGDSFSDAPTYDEAVKALTSQKISVFAAAPSAPGYDKKFSSQQAGLVAASNGLYFKYSDLLAGKITMNTILTKVIQRIETIYQVQYAASENSDIDSSLPMSQRNISLSLPNMSEAKIKVLQTQSNWPEGRPRYKNRWRLSDRAVDPHSLSVKINDQDLNTGYSLDNGEIVFAKTPTASARVEVQYAYLSMADNLKIEPVILKIYSEKSDIRVFFNDQLAQAADYVIEKTLEGHFTLRPSANALNATDAFQIKKYAGLKIRVTIRNQPME